MNSRTSAFLELLFYDFVYISKRRGRLKAQRPVISLETGWELARSKHFSLHLLVPDLMEPRHRSVRKIDPDLLEWNFHYFFVLHKALPVHQSPFHLFFSATLYEFLRAESSVYVDPVSRKQTTQRHADTCSKTFSPASLSSFKIPLVFVWLKAISNIVLLTRSINIALLASLCLIRFVFLLWWLLLCIFNGENRKHS